MRGETYHQHDKKDHSMLTAPRLKINDIVVVWEEDDGGEWTQARVVDAQFNRYRKLWEYSAVVEFVDEEDHVEHAGGHHQFGENGHHMIFECPHTYKTQEIAIKQWYCFSDQDLLYPVSSSASGLPIVKKKE